MDKKLPIALKLRSTAMRSVLGFMGFQISTSVKLLLAKSTCCREGRRKNQLCSVPEMEFSLSSTTSS